MCYGQRMDDPGGAGYLPRRDDETAGLPTGSGTPHQMCVAFLSLSFVSVLTTGRGVAKYPDAPACPSVLLIVEHIKGRYMRSGLFTAFPARTFGHGWTDSRCDVVEGQDVLWSLPTRCEARRGWICDRSMYYKTYSNLYVIDISRMMPFFDTRKGEGDWAHVTQLRRSRLRSRLRAAPELP